MLSAEYAQAKRPEIVEWTERSDSIGEVTTHVTQLDAHRAIIWVSQRFRASKPESDYSEVAFRVTTRAELQRENGIWSVTSVTREDGLFVDELVENVSGRVIGLITQNNQRGSVVAELDTQVLAWKALSELPSAFSPLPSHSVLREGKFLGGAEYNCHQHIQ